MFDERLKELRIAQNLNQVALGKILGVSKQCISNWENNNIQPSIDMLMKIAEYFGVTTDYLLGLEENLYVNVDGLTAVQRDHIQQIINDIKS
ncbi:MAG: helix-turn-helix transcriptional regulator [Clostridia bacterium]|nr:helix-turn-helix transcriptional regulator [Clostridia bacterium]